VNSFRIPPLMRYRRVVLPAALPYIATGVKLSLSISILVAVGAEILMQVPGIGSQINLARTYNEVPVAIVFTLYAGLMGVALSQGWDWIERRMLAWHHREGGL
jgi:NitT/TauT family transport system permease protein